MILFIAMVITLLSIMITTITKKIANRKNPPGPYGLPFIGNLHQFDRAKPHIYLWQLSKKYGPLTYLKHWSTPILVVNSTKMATEILKYNDRSFCTRPSVFGQKKLAYNGIDIAFSPYNRHWRMMKKLCVVHLLSPKQVLAFRPIREDEVSCMIDKISNLSSLSRPVNLSEIAMSVASNFICRVSFGRRYDDDEYDKIKFDRLIMEAQALMVSFYFSDHFPTLGWIDKLSGLLSRLDKNCKELDVFYQQLIDEHLNPSRPKPDKQDIIDLMVQLKDQNTSTLDLTWDHIKALLMDLIVAGTDTVAASIVWAMTALIKRPEIMKKAQLEIRQLLVVNNVGKNIVDEDDIKKLPYIKAVVLEALRMYPPAPLIYRTQISQDTCLIQGHVIRPGTSVIVNGWAMARDPETWKNPDEFLPERFTMMSTNTTTTTTTATTTDNGHHQNSTKVVMFDKIVCEKLEMIPFGGGRRGCPGMGMGLISTELALANLLYAFDWELPDEQDIDISALPGLTMHKKNPLVLVPKNYILKSN